MEKVNVHYYDGKLKERAHIIRQIHSDVPQISLAQKLKAYDCLWAKIMTLNRVSPSAQYMFFILVNDIKKGRQYPQNFDPTNGLYVEDLLYICYLITEKDEDMSDFYALLIDQLVEMTTGPCVQGRTYRLLQIISNYT